MPEGRNKRSLTARDRRPLDVRLRPFKSSSASQLRIPLAFSRRRSGYSLRCGREMMLSLRDGEVVCLYCKGTKMAYIYLIEGRIPLL